MGELDALAPGGVFQLVTPFVPGPMLEKASDRGFESFAAVEGAGAVRTFFRRREAAAC